MKGDAGIKTIPCDDVEDHPAHAAAPNVYCPGVKIKPGPRMIFSTIHGSHLYGLDYDGSDTDVYTVIDSTAPKAGHAVVREPDGDYDYVTIGFNTFLVQALRGSHQSVEALFSPYKAWNPQYEHLKPFIESAVVCGPAVYERYERTIHKFCFGDFKRRRHAVRLSLNLRDLRESGRFNPVMTTDDRDYATGLAYFQEGEELWTRLTT